LQSAKTEVFIFMSLWIAVLVFLAGVVLVVKGGDLFVDAASWIARAAHIPPFIVGATIVSFATTLPELIVSVMASLEGKNDMAVGNAVGSVTANTGLILAIALIFMTVVAPRARYWRQCVLLIAAAGVLWLGSLQGTMAAWANVALFVVFVGFMALNVMDAKDEPGENEPVVETSGSFPKHIGLFLVGAAMIVLGSELLINGGSSLAEALGVPERVIAVTMVAIGTSLPELVTTLTAIRKKEANLSVGNIIGANIIDLTLILPICSLVSGKPLPVAAASIRYDLPACLLVTLVALVPMLWKEKASKAQGILLLVIYAVYLFVTV
jgi:cation:H+ antiporter